MYDGPEVTFYTYNFIHEKMMRIRFIYLNMTVVSIDTAQCLPK